MTTMQTIGLMSGTSLDGVDAALIETNGRDIARPLHGLTVYYDDAFQARLRALIAGGQSHAERLAIIRDLTLLHAEAVQRLLIETSRKASDIALIGFHGQTTYHDPSHGITEQAGDAPLLEARTGIKVISDFRRGDVARGGQGAPLVPLYHVALAAKLPKPVVFLNIGGVANITFIGANGEVIAYDTGPGNALINDWVHKHVGQNFDENGALALSGTPRMDIVSEYMTHPFFMDATPKSLDRNAFSLAPLQGLDVMDGAATLVAFTTEAVKHTLKQLGAEDAAIYVCGGGRHNPAIMQRLPQAKPVEVLRLNGDFIEAEAFAYLAARKTLGLPLFLNR